MLVDNYVTPVLRLSMTTLINNYVKLVIMFINVTLTIELKIYFSWNNTLL